MDEVTWGDRRVSSRSTGANNCVELAHGRAENVAVGVWDTKHRQSGPLVFRPVEWSGFLAAVKAGRFNG